MRASLFIVAVVVAASTALASTANATAPASVTIAGTVTQFGPPPDFRGTWSSGELGDAGPFVETELHLTGALANSPVVGVFQAVIVFTGSQGTFTVAQEAQFTSFPKGTWQVISGTDAYARASGHGTFAFSPPDSLTFTGVISKSG